LKNQNKKNAKSLAELNKMNPLTKKILIAATTLFTLGVVSLAVFNVVNSNYLKTPEEVAQTVSGRIASLSNAYYQSESKMISVFSSNSKNFEAFAVYDIGSKSSISDPDSSNYKLEPISGDNKAKVNYFRLEDGTYLRSVYNVNNDYIIGNYQIKESSLDVWQRFDKAQENLAKKISNGDKINLKDYEELEALIKEHDYLRN
jgi:hypothetical protein